jgi:hypothetical protein
MKSPVVLFSSLFDGVERLVPGVKGLDRDFITIKSRFEHEGYGFISITLPSLCDAVDYGLAHGRFTCPTSFSKVRGGSIPKFLSGLICNVFDPITGLLLDSPHASYVKHLREILRLFKKITLTQKREALLHSDAVKGFISTDDSITMNSFPGDMLHYLRTVSAYVLPSLLELREDLLKPKHGPGGVAEGLSSNQKWVELHRELEKDPYVALKYGLDIISRNRDSGSNQPVGEQLSFENVLLYSDYLNGLSTQPTSSRCAKLLSVPKSSSARRTITAEPMLYQFLQQGLNLALRDSISKCSILRRCLTLSDQSKNQKLALLGSLSGKYATIDLSSASDLLSLDLVQEVFATKAHFLKCAVESRSELCDTKLSGIITMQKFAGMGNALTFPVQSVVFALLAICGLLCSEGKDPSYVNVKRAASRVRVYGDDIIVPTSAVCQVYTWLASFGLKVNQKKSFTTGYFRESCGVDAYKGVNVTPVYVRHWPSSPSGDPVTVASLVSASNQFWMLGLYETAKLLEDMVESLVGSLPCVSSKSQSLGWHSRVDTNISPCRWDGKLQRLVFRGLVVTTQMRSDPLDDYAALYKSLMTMESRHNGEIPDVDKLHLQRSVKRFHTRLRPRWLPAQAG